MIVAILLILTGFSSYFLTGWVRKYALTRSLMDLPNERSSHSTPTPSGAGIAIAVSFLACCLIFNIYNFISDDFFYALVGSGVLVSVIGFIDDHNHIRVRWRLLVHVIAVIWVMFFLGRFPPLTVFNTEIDFGIVGDIFFVLYFIWVLNLFNFMDGIDGIAGIEMLTVALGGAMMLASLSEDVELIFALSAIACSVIGFLFWNFPKAKIFMGDVGSGFLGMLMGVMAIKLAHTSSELFWAWTILLGVFVVDASITLFRRMFLGEKFYEAHRSHAYQKAAILLGRHAPVSLFVGFVNLIWLFPIGWLVSQSLIDAVAGLLFSYIPLVALALYFGAGKD